MWTIGIDEAGYGPNLGPLVMTAVAFTMERPVNLWDSLSPEVAKTRRGKSACCLVNDSKKVYQSGKGLTELARTTLAFLKCAGDAPIQTLADLLNTVRIDDHGIDEPWYLGSTILGAVELPAKLPERLAEQGVRVAAIHSVVVDAPRFNRIVDRSGSKGTVLADGLVRLLRHLFERLPNTPGTIVVDKHGGRNRYAPLLQEVSPDLWITPIEEGMTSVYEIRWPDRRATITFRPEADATSFEVSLASIVSKYIRELCMEEFNAFWRRHVPDLQPTAGYPVDAIRFLKDIRPTLETLQLPFDRLWRSR